MNNLVIKNNCSIFVLERLTKYYVLSTHIRLPLHSACRTFNFTFPIRESFKSPLTILSKAVLDIDCLQMLNFNFQVIGSDNISKEKGSFQGGTFLSFSLLFFWLLVFVSFSFFETN